MSNYCQGYTKATVNITFPEKEKIILKSTPILVDVVLTNQGIYQDYIHNMNQKIDKTFDRAITNVILKDSNNKYIFSGEYPPSDPRVNRTCPLPSIQGNKIYLDFDPGAYADNSGSCVYTIFFGGWTLTATNAIGQQIKRNYNQKPIFNVACGDNCPDGYLRCDCNEYPGYCCIPCSEIKGEIANAKALLRNINYG